MEKSEFHLRRKYLHSDAVLDDARAGKLRVVGKSRASKANRPAVGVSRDDRSRLLALKKRRLLVAELRMQGLSYEEIAHVIRTTFPNAPTGYSRALVAADLNYMLDTLQQSSLDALRRMRSLEGMRIDWAMLKVVQRIERGDTVQFTRLIELYIKLSAARCALFGLNAPVQVNAALFGDISINYELDPDEYAKAEADPNKYVDAKYTIQRPDDVEDDEPSKALVPVESFGIM